jgi:hypothetical protein
MNKMYFITSMTHGPIDKNWRTRTHGYFDNLERAIKAVEINEGGLDECLYDFVVIEPIPPGIYGFLDNDIDKDETIWYKWIHPKNEHGRWEKCERPEEFRHCCNFSIG